MTDIVMLHIQLILIFLAIVLLILYLKKKGVFSDDYREVFDRLVTELVFPVVIFSGLLTRDFSFEWIFQSAILMVAIFLCGIIAYAGCRLLGLSRKKPVQLFLFPLLEAQQHFQRLWSALIMAHRVWHFLR